ncbi:phosphate/phosphite/phosphonate ABC transporter substrate-binding protein [Amycolatopsis saalfeldensis]|uniref:4,5-dihydroxyphthalate decarboxylase n=1 Tax=Amycolatopsis saalfeldensis TaxID=394193 RepID=A0A1H8VHI4_9PSEU|nr:phosphate/phosphite/phosphonate ABC transporter substrate-binding protein [Amycolatopsis saalfeldensis]SEP14912.1 4,5-dihydroxyphthalate decarboxylase [Amycolatopsis saalfeldensis]
MSVPRLKMASLAYDQFRALEDGTVRVDGAELEIEHPRIISEVYRRMITEHAFDLAELGLTFYLRTLEFDEPPFVALPVFPARAFRHSAVFVNAGSGIERPGDLEGRTIGEFSTYGHDGGVWAKGFLADDFGVDPAKSRWLVGGLDRPAAPIDYLPLVHPPQVDVRRAPAGADLGAMLAAGEIDALISGNVPKAVLDGSPAIRRLFPDYGRVEREYFARTGIFPIAHVMVLKREAVAADPTLAPRLYRALDASRTVALNGHRTGRVTNFVESMFPWLNELADHTAGLLGPDPWAYGVEPNRATIDTFLRYHWEQGLSPRRIQVDELFVDSLMST